MHNADSVVTSVVFPLLDGPAVCRAVPGRQREEHQTEQRAVEHSREQLHLCGTDDRTRGHSHLVARCLPPPTTNEIGI